MTGRQLKSLGSFRANRPERDRRRSGSICCADVSAGVTFKSAPANRSSCTGYFDQSDCLGRLQTTAPGCHVESRDRQPTRSKVLIPQAGSPTCQFESAAKRFAMPSASDIGRRIDRKWDCSNSEATSSQFASDPVDVDQSTHETRVQRDREHRAACRPRNPLVSLLPGSRPKHSTSARRIEGRTKSGVNSTALVASPTRVGLRRHGLVCLGECRIDFVPSTVKKVRTGSVERERTSTTAPARNCGRTSRAGSLFRR